ncbi:hypothetical protein F5Y04DRAFT_250545 [Hypomontagnella monticulosa]|nr:hypothetical protein F5Y04DRAFT_250545 [Hypomontagnella monticulosa]
MQDIIEDGVDIPFQEEHELLHSLSETLPGRPLISLKDKAVVSSYLVDELSTKRLQQLYGMLFLVSNRRNISPLHHQLIKGREILVTERPDLHLVWYYERIFIKPIPRCLFSHSFWETHLRPFREDLAGPNLYLEARGFLRTYASLIVHESDFMLAKNKGLIPNDLQWNAWCHFIEGFGHIRDNRVSPRYHYGELRLTRLNFWSKVFLRGQNYFDVHHNYITYFSRFGAPFSFLFGVFTVMLGALQTALQVYPHGTYRDLASKLIPISMLSSLLAVVSIPLLFASFQVHEIFLFLLYHRKLL